VVKGFADWIRKEHTAAWFFVFVYASLIFYLSSIQKLPEPIKVKNVDVFYHVIEYGILGFLLFVAMRRTKQIPRSYVLPLAVVFAALYGLSDELHQLFVPGRLCNIKDMLSDFLGSGIGAVLANRDIKI